MSRFAVRSSQRLRDKPLMTAAGWLLALVGLLIVLASVRALMQPLYNDVGGSLDCDNAWVVVTNEYFEYDLEGDHVEQPWSHECVREADKTWRRTKPWLIVGAVSAVVGFGVLAKRRWDRSGIALPPTGD